MSEKQDSNLAEKNEQQPDFIAQNKQIQFNENLYPIHQEVLTLVKTLDCLNVSKVNKFNKVT